MVIDRELSVCFIRTSYALMILRSKFKIVLVEGCRLG